MRQVHVAAHRVSDGLAGDCSAERSVPVDDGERLVPVAEVAPQQQVAETADRAVEVKQQPATDLVGDPAIRVPVAGPVGRVGWVCELVPEGESVRGLMARPGVSRRAQAPPASSSVARRRSISV